MIFYTEYRISQLNSARIINQLQSNGIIIKRMSKKEGGLSFQVSKKDVSKLENLFFERAIGFEKIKEKSIKKVVNSILSHFACCICILLIIAGMWTGSLFCFSIEINCANGQLKTEVSQLLANNNIKPNIPKTKLNTDAIGNLVLSSIDKVAFAEARFFGGKLVIDVVEQHQIDGYPPTKTQIVAMCDCIITRVIVTSGTAQVKEGETIKKGQVLIDGYIDLGDPADPNNVRQPVTASGQVFGRVWATASETISAKYFVEERTGKTSKYTDLNFFGIKWTSKKKSSYKCYEKEKKVTIFGNFFPIKSEKTTIYETRIIEKQTTQSDLDNKTTELYIDLMRTLPKDAKLLGSWNIQKRLDNLYILDIYYELEQDVAC